MGNAVDKLIALAGSVQVSGYRRTSKTGKVVSVSSYTRSPSDMSDKELMSESISLGAKVKRGAATNAEKNRAKAVMSEIRERQNRPHGMGPAQFKEYRSLSPSQRSNYSRYRRDGSSHPTALRAAKSAGGNPAIRPIKKDSVSQKEVFAAAKKMQAASKAYAASKKAKK